MAVARLSVGIGKKGKAAPHALYIAREEKYAKTDDDLEKLEFKGHGNMPEWAQAKPSIFWKMSDEHERKNGTTYREHVISLPRELTPLQRHRLVTDWIEQEINDKHAYQYAIHNPPAIDGGEQPHVHLMFSERLRDGIEREPDLYFKRYNSKSPERGGAKKANTPKLSADRKAELVAQRDRWEQLCNKHLALSGTDARISMKSLKEQGIEREPFNLTMKQIKSDRYESVYKDLKQAERSSKLATEDVEDLIDVAAELRKLNTLKLTNNLFGSAMPPMPQLAQTDQHQKADAEPFVLTIEDRAKIEPVIAFPNDREHRVRWEYNEDENDPYFEHKLDKNQHDLLMQFKEENGLLVQDGEFRQYRLDNIEFLKDPEKVAKNKDIIEMLLDPAEHRRKIKQDTPVVEQETVKIEENEVAKEAQTNRASIRMRR